jgi:signal transduction histidine kinase
VVEERLRIAREMHDVLSHSLASINLQAGVGLHLVDRQPERAQEALRTIRQISADALGQARAALAVVRGKGGDQPAAPGLADLDALAGSVRANGLKVDLDTNLGGRPVSEMIGTTAFRIVQEALTNVIRHAGSGAHAKARVGRVHDWLEIEVTDDGAGAAAPVRSSGHGLRGMAERVSEVGGELLAGPAPGGGFTVRARLPLGSTQ